MNIAEIENLYRYEADRICNRSDEFSPEYYIQINLYTYSVIKTTRCGHWIKALDKKKFVNFNNIKRFAYPTLEEAKESFVARKTRQVSILNNQLKDARTALRLAERGAFPDA